MYDLVVIGAGPGGYIAAITAAELGLKVACISDEPRLGGTCLNVGCIPSKSLLETTELYHRLQKHGKELGVDNASYSPNLDVMMSRKGKIIHQLGEGIEQLFRAKHVQLYIGKGTIVHPHGVEVNLNGEKSLIEGKAILLATGSKPIPWPGLAFDENQILSSTGALSLQEIPKTLCIIGAGVIGVEIGSIYARLGSQVTIVEILQGTCTFLDHTIQPVLQKSLEELGIRFLFNRRVTEIKKQKKEVILSVRHENEESQQTAEKLLICTGRAPYSDGLNLEKVGIKADSHGFIPVNSSFQTVCPSIFAIGDLIRGGSMLAHRASIEGKAVAYFLAGQPGLVCYAAIPNVIYTFPEVASVGYTEKEAKKQGLDVITGTSFFRHNGRACCAGETAGCVKVVAEKNSGHFLGWHIVGVHASELIALGALTIQTKQRLIDWSLFSIAHPTLSETMNEAVEQAFSSFTSNK